MNPEETVNKIQKLRKIRSWCIFGVILCAVAAVTKITNGLTAVNLFIFKLSVVCFVLSLVAAIFLQFIIKTEKRKLKPGDVPIEEAEIKREASPEYSLPVIFINDTGINPQGKMIRIIAGILIYIILLVYRNVQTEVVIILMLLGLVMWVWVTFRSISLINFRYDGVHFISAGYARWNIGSAFSVSYSDLVVKQDPISADKKTVFYNGDKKVYTMYSRSWSVSWKKIHSELRRRIDKDKCVLYEIKQNEAEGKYN